MKHVEWHVPRLVVFSDQPNYLLVYVPDGLAAQLPVLRAPFTKTGLGLLFGDRGLPARITESPSGTLSAHMRKVRGNEKSERRQREQLKQAHQIAIDRASGMPLARSRAEALAKKNAVDAELQCVKAWLAEARTRLVTQGRFTDPQLYRKKERELADLKLESQALQAELGRLRESEKELNAQVDRDENRLFKEAALRVLPEDMLDKIYDAMDYDEEELSAPEL